MLITIIARYTCTLLDCWDVGMLSLRIIVDEMLHGKRAYSYQDIHLVEYIV